MFRRARLSSSELCCQAICLLLVVPRAHPSLAALWALSSQPPGPRFLVVWFAPLAVPESYFGEPSCDVLRAGNAKTDPEKRRRNCIRARSTSSRSIARAIYLAILVLLDSVFEAH